MRRIALLLLLGILFTAAACGEEDTATDEDSTPTVEVKRGQPCSDERRAIPLDSCQRTGRAREA